MVYLTRLLGLVNNISEPVLAARCQLRWDRPGLRIKETNNISELWADESFKDLAFNNPNVEYLRSLEAIEPSVLTSCIACGSTLESSGTCANCPVYNKWEVGDQSEGDTIRGRLMRRRAHAISEVRVGHEDAEDFATDYGWGTGPGKFSALWSNEKSSAVRTWLNDPIEPGPAYPATHEEYRPRPTSEEYQPMYWTFSTRTNRSRSGTLTEQGRSSTITILNQQIRLLDQIRSLNQRACLSGRRIR
ncbi:hypothetical protein BDV96DRAFT_405530 [Lophiotrema nucula]|uniref:Uncharacterized protein n=1 Tax=Lophiotrema nucula TaxID=690887 RepID=A0A6A5ZHN8_9PLEO|nr:hypothetical protein BDV96DRAFT_405530 [Lophiotrema nucula]